MALDSIHMLRTPLVFTPTPARSTFNITQNLLTSHHFHNFHHLATRPLSPPQPPEFHPHSHTLFLPWWPGGICKRFCQVVTLPCSELSEAPTSLPTKAQILPTALKALQELPCYFPALISSHSPPHWPPHCLSNTPMTLPPRSHCICCSLCLKCSSPRSLHCSSITSLWSLFKCHLVCGPP